MKIQFDQELIDALRNRVFFNFTNSNIEYVTFYSTYLDLVLTDGHNYLNMKLGDNYFKLFPVFKIHKDKLSNYYEYVVFYSSPEAYYISFNEQSVYIYVSDKKLSIFSCDYSKQKNSLVSTIPITTADNLDSFRVILNMIKSFPEKDKIKFLTT